MRKIKEKKIRRKAADIDRKFMCEFCKVKGYGSRNALNTHIKNKHNFVKDLDDDEDNKKNKKMRLTKSNELKKKNDGMNRQDSFSDDSIDPIPVVTQSTISFFSVNIDGVMFLNEFKENLFYLSFDLKKELIYINFISNGVPCVLELFFYNIKKIIIFNNSKLKILANFPKCFKLNEKKLWEQFQNFFFGIPQIKENTFHYDIELEMTYISISKFVQYIEESSLDILRDKIEIDDLEYTQMDQNINFDGILPRIDSTITWESPISKNNHLLIALNQFFS